MQKIGKKNIAEGTGLHVRNLSAGYGKKGILHGIDFTAEENTVVGIIGSNGCGKTTLLKALCGILSSEGEVLFAGRDLNTLSVKERARLCGYIPQRSGITVSLSVLDAVLMGCNPRLSPLEYPGRDMREKAKEVLVRTGLSEKTDMDYQVLSEGQKQLCMLSRLMISDCRLVFLDEPESALDFGGRYRMMDLLRNYITERNGTALVTLHDPQLALEGCDCLLMLKDGICIGEVYPKKEKVEEIEKKLRLLYGPLSVCRVLNRQGRERLVMIREAE